MENDGTEPLTEDQVLELIGEAGDGNPLDALRVLLNYGQTDGAHHKLWVIDEAVRALAGKYYDELIRAWQDGEDGPNTYEWETGTPP